MCVNTVCVELPLGMTLGEVIDGPCGGMLPGEPLQGMHPRRRLDPVPDR